jgi:hypothetical protein
MTAVLAHVIAARRTSSTSDRLLVLRQAHNGALHVLHGMAPKLHKCCTTACCCGITHKQHASAAVRAAYMLRTAVAAAFPTPSIFQVTRCTVLSTPEVVVPAKFQGGPQGAAALLSPYRSNR